MDLGLLVEGVLEEDPSTGLPVVRVPENGQVVDVVSELRKYIGEEVRVIATPLAVVAELARLVAEGGVEIE